MAHHFYTTFAKYYDKIYSNHNIQQETAFLLDLIRQYKIAPNNKLLDVCCGTGMHAEEFQAAGLQVTGMDLNEKMLEQARPKSGMVNYLEADMKNFHLEEKFGTIFCFLNSILYNKNSDELKNTLQRFYDHLEPGGILVFDAFDKASAAQASNEQAYEYSDSNVTLRYSPEWFYDRSENKLRLEITFKINEEVILDFHEMGAFSLDEIYEILKKIGFEVTLLERDFNQIKPYSGQWHDAIFVGLRGHGPSFIT
ncbi:hypothetical protein COV82_01005 [Candidatus Peregrinibacteria bacterium CG11_big_fil_rev_8_21_14_0_20_46_8]|nr:MAG: hypothetical protein COV82_01005 [Candidatus Peregrinibacteria bacterium CG11_big_fil_rev_8_21_14_0_20_46_8]